MAKRDYFIRYLFIIRKLRKCESASFEEIADFVFQQSELLDSPIKLNIRTFQRDVREISTIFGIDIKCNRKTNRYAVLTDHLEYSAFRILEAFDIFSALTQMDHVDAYLLPEKRCALGTEFLFDLLTAIKHKQIVTFIYQKYDDSESSLREVEPLALKEFRNRWYLFANDMQDDSLKTFGLDRIRSVCVTGNNFSALHHPDPFLHYRDCFGIFRPAEGTAEEVVFVTTREQAMYLKSFPLHESQQVLDENDTECRFSLRVFITYDFIMELMAMGESVKVISPVSLRKELYRQAKELSSYYRHD